MQATSAVKMNESSPGSRDQQISRTSGANDGCFSERERDNATGSARLVQFSLSSRSLSSL